MIEYLLVDGWSKRWVEDDYEHGEIGNAGYFEGNEQFKGVNVQSLLQALLDFTGADWLDFYLPYEDNEGPTNMIQISVLENAEGCRACESERKDWKRGLKPLYAAEYTFIVEKITSEPVTITTAQLAEFSKLTGTQSKPFTRKK